MLTHLKNNLFKLTPSESSVANFIIQNPTETSYLTIQELAKTVGTSTTTIMRLSAKLGYSGYAELQNALQAFIKEDNAPKSRLMNSPKVSDDKLWGATLAHIGDQIASLATTMDESSLALAINALTYADKILITATRSGLPVGVFLAQNLNRINGKSQFIQADLSDWVDEVASLNDNSVLIAITFPRYARRIYDFAKVAKQKGATVIALTDSYAVPLVEKSDIALICQAKSLSFYNSPISAFVVAEYLIGALAKKQSEQLQERLGDVQQVLGEIGYHL